MPGTRDRRITSGPADQIVFRCRPDRRATLNLEVPMDPIATANIILSAMTAHKVLEDLQR